ncbi:MAG: SDR family oxidoreductase [Bacteroidetes bacterium]|nr:SDR family oxidoreductase [Bacteroidota bacterium]
MQYFQNKVTWITGASSGIGEALAYALSAAGAMLILSSRKQNELERVKNQCAHPEKIKIIQLDLENASSLQEKTKEAIAAFDHIDIMIHNGGISQRSFVIDTSMEVQRKVMEVDYFSYVSLTNYLLPHFIERKSGHFVIMSSVMGKIGTPKRSAYAAAKHALHGFFDCLRAEVADQNILVTIITPGYIRTNVSVNAVTGSGGSLGIMAHDIEQGLPADKAATQIMKAVASGKFEAYVGKNGKEKLALIINRFAPNLLIKSAVKQVPT